MSKSPLERAMEKQRKEEQKAARQARIRDRASAIVLGAEVVGGFRVMDREAETTLQCILDQYDGNDNNYVNFDSDKLPSHLQESCSLEFEKLQMYGMLTSANIYINGAMLTLI